MKKIITAVIGYIVLAVFVLMTGRAYGQNATVENPNSYPLTYSFGEGSGANIPRINVTLPAYTTYQLTLPDDIIGFVVTRPDTGATIVGWGTWWSGGLAGKHGLATWSSGGWYTTPLTRYAPAPSGGGWGTEFTPDELEIFFYGFYTVLGMGLTALMFYVIRRLTAQDHRP